MSRERSTPRTDALDFRRLRMLVAIVDQGGMTRAARHLHLSQSALSHQLRQLESELGAPVFLRLKRRLVVTDAGRMLIERARPILNELETLADDVRQHATGARGRLRIATECYTCYEWLPPLLARFRTRHPGVDVSIVAEATDDPIASLVAGAIDLAIVTRVPEAAGVECHPLFDDELLIVVPAEHPLAGAAHVRPSDLARERLLLYTPPAENNFYRDYFGRTAVRPARIDVIRVTEAILSMVRSGLGVTVAARWAIASQLRSGRLVGVRIGPRGFHRSWMGAMRRVRGAAQPAFVTEFLRQLRESVEPVRHATRRPARRSVIRSA